MHALTTRPVKITDTTLRDAHQSLMATRMGTEHMLPIVEKMDHVGFFSIEVWGGATFDVCIRYLDEDPWERLRQLKEHIRRTPLQMLLRGQNVVGYRNYPDDVVVRFVEKAQKNGIDVFRIFDALNDVRNMEMAVKTVNRLGAHSQGSICYTISPVHTIQHYVENAERLAALGCKSICIKDMAGILAPQVAHKLIRSLNEEVGLPVHLHCHSTSGMAMMTYLRACDAGVDILDTAFSPLAGGTSQPPVESVVAGLGGMPYDPGFDMGLLNEIAGYFRELRDRFFDTSRLIDSKSEQVDPSIVIHQIPGGMFSNLLSQLREQNALDRLAEVLEEVPIVRRELGYPPLVTPTSQIVGTQAVLNVLSGKRYGMVPNEVRDYVRGLYGRPPTPIDEEIGRMIVGDEEPIKVRPSDLLEPVLGKIPEDVRPYIESEEDEITYALFPKMALEFFKKRVARREEAETGIALQRAMELEDAAAASVAIAAYLTSLRGSKAVIPARVRGFTSPWVLTGRKSLAKHGV